MCHGHKYTKLATIEKLNTESHTLAFSISLLSVNCFLLMGLSLKRWDMSATVIHTQSSLVLKSKAGNEGKTVLHSTLASFLCPPSRSLRFLLMALSSKGGDTGHGCIEKAYWCWTDGRNWGQDRIRFKTATQFSTSGYLMRPSFWCLMAGLSVKYVSCFRIQRVMMLNRKQRTFSSLAYFSGDFFSLVNFFFFWRTILFFSLFIAHGV